MCGVQSFDMATADIKPGGKAPLSVGPCGLPTWQAHEAGLNPHMCVYTCSSLLHVTLPGPSHWPLQ